MPTVTLTLAQTNNTRRRWGEKNWGSWPSTQIVNKILHWPQFLLSRVQRTKCAVFKYYTQAPLNYLPTNLTHWHISLSLTVLFFLFIYRSGDRFIEEKTLLLAVRSYVFFSQLSAWLSASHGIVPRNILYRFDFSFLAGGIELQLTWALCTRTRVVLKLNFFGLQLQKIKSPRW